MPVGYTDTTLKRGAQIDAVYEYWSKASDAYVRGGGFDSGPATRWLKKMRDYLNKEFPEKKGKRK